MGSLVVCPGCARHVKSDESACPFCQQSLAPKACAGVCFGPPTTRFGRAALMVAGAALLGVGCSTANTTPAYGTIPFPDASRETQDATPGHDGGVHDTADGAPDAGSDVRAPK